MTDSRTSNNSAPLNAPAVEFENSPKVAAYNKSYIKTIPGANMAVFAASFDADGVEEINAETKGAVDAVSENAKSPKSTTANKKIFPQLSDISVIKNEIVLDSAGVPTVSLMFRINNSSGAVVKAIGARVQVI